jgi:hypothetical protein
VDVLPLPLIGWLYTFGCGIALLLGTWLTLGAYKSGAAGRRALAERMLDDMFLYSVWLLGLAGGAGVLMEQSWSLWVLQLFCWALIVLTFMSAFGRWRAALPPRGLMALSLALFVLPLVFVCAATILTLRGETALRVLVR